MKQYAKSLGFKNVRVKSYLEYAEGTAISPIYIDLIEDFLNFLFSGKVAGFASQTAEVISLNPYRVFD